MANIETDLIIKAISQGFDKVSKDMKDLGKAGDEVEKGTDKASKGIGAFDVALGNLASGALQMATDAIVDFVKGSIKAASDVEEMQGKFTIVFKETADAVEADLARMAEATGASKFELMGFAATLQDTFVPLGFAREEAADMSTQLVQLAVDLASFNNLNTADVVRDLQSALVGNTETLRKYGVVAQETQIKAEALSLGLWDGTGAIDAQSKASAILSLTLKGTADAQGDAVRTADSYANKQRALESAMLDLQVAIGQQLIPTMLELVSVANKAVISMKGLVDAIAVDKQLQDTAINYKELRKEIGKVAVESVKTNDALNLTEKQLKQQEITARLSAEVLELLQAGISGTAEELVGYAQAAIAADMRAEAMNDAFRDQVVATEEVIEVTEELTRLTAEQSRAIVRATQENHTYELSEGQAEEAIEKRTEAQEAEIAAMAAAAEAEAELTQRTSEYFQASLPAIENTDSLEAQLYEAAEAAGASATELAILGTGLGLFSEEAVEAALKAAAIKIKIDELAQAYADGEISIEDMRKEAENFIGVLNGDFDQAATEGAQAISEIENSALDAKLAIDELSGVSVDFDVSAALAKLNELQNSADVLANKLGGLGGPETTPAPTAGGGTTGGSGAPYDPGASPTGGPIGGQHGLKMIVPPGFRNDSFLFAASSGEEVTIKTQDQQRGGRGGVNMSVIINEPMNGNPFVAGRIMGEQFANKMGVRG